MKTEANAPVYVDGIAGPVYNSAPVSAPEAAGLLERYSEMFAATRKRLDAYLLERDGPNQQPHDPR